LDCRRGDHLRAGCPALADNESLHAANLRVSCLPEPLLDGEIPSSDDFPEIRRRLMAQKIKTRFEAL
jgi:hypothetical protein